MSDESSGAEGREVHEVLYRLGDLAGRLDAYAKITNQMHDRLLYLEREVLPAIGRRSAFIGAGGGLAAASSIIAGLYYLKGLL